MASISLPPRLPAIARALAFAVCCSVWLPDELEAQTIEGTVENIVDGDTFDFSGLRIRLCGIEAPEEGAPGFERAKEALTALIAGRYVVCLPVGAGSVCDGRSKQFNRDRVVAQCFLEDSDIAALMVKHGHACDWPKFSGGTYRGGCAR